jgi:hypothetical protein
VCTFVPPIRGACVGPSYGSCPVTHTSSVGPNGASATFVSRVTRTSSTGEATAWLRSRLIAMRIRVFAVPRGIRRAAATCSWVNSSKNASDSACLSGAGHAKRFSG